MEDNYKAITNQFYVIKSICGLNNAKKNIEKYKPHFWVIVWIDEFGTPIDYFSNGLNIFYVLNNKLHLLNRELTLEPRVNNSPVLVFSTEFNGKDTVFLDEVLIFTPSGEKVNYK